MKIPAPQPVKYSDDMPLGPEDYDPYDDGECANCGGEGVVYMCDQEFACIDPEGGCDDCARRCDWCSPRKPTPSTPGQPAPEQEKST